MNIDLNQRKIALELSYLNVIKVSGRDAISFLNDQFTNDITSLEHNQWQFNGYCSSKGRLIAIMRLFVDADCVYIVLPKQLADAIIKRLQVYVFRAKVKFETLADHNIYGLIGEDAKNCFGELQTLEVKSDDNGFVLNTSMQPNRYLVILKSADALTELEVLSESKSEQLWRLSEIRQLIPNINVLTSEQFIPQHINLDKLDGVSFKKGCFPGQEVVARLHYLGKAKQTMKHLEIESVDDVVAGETLTHPDYKKALKIVDAVRTEENKFECLAVGQFD